MELRCKKCKIQKEAIESNFYFRKDKGVIKWRKVCKSCVAISSLENYRKNKEKIKIRQQEHYQLNKSKKREYYLNNREKISKQDRAREAVKRKCGIYRLRKNINRVIHFSIFKTGNSKNNISFLKHVDFTIDSLRQHLESQFESWMSWDNYGAFRVGGERKWHIDHIIPQSKLLYDSMEHPNFKKLWALSNLRPLDAQENMSKGNKILLENLCSPSEPTI